MNAENELLQSVVLLKKMLLMLQLVFDAAEERGSTTSMMTILVLTVMKTPMLTNQRPLNPQHLDQHLPGKEGTKSPKQKHRKKKL